MKTLTQSERNEIRGLIRKKHDSQIQLIKAKHPRLDEQVEKTATEQAVKVLGVEKLVKQKVSLEGQIEELEKALRAVNAQISTRLPAKKNGHRGACPTPMDLCEAVADKKETLLPAIKASHATYKQIVKIESEMQNRLAKLEAVSSRDQLNGLLD